MKKFILAPAVALAFTGLIAAPVAAAESPSTQSADAAGAKTDQAEKDKAEQAKKHKAKKAAEKKAADKKAAEEKAEADQKAKAGKDKKSDSKDKPKKTAPPTADPKPKDDNKSDNDKSDDAKVEKLNASLKLSTSSIKAEDLAEDGIEVTVTNLKKGDKVSTNGGDLTADTTTASGSTATLTLQTSKASKHIPNTQRFALKVQRAGVPAQALTRNVAVIRADSGDAGVDPIDASLKVAPKKITAEDLADEDKGIMVTVSGVKKGDEISDSLTGKTETADADGDYKLRIHYLGDTKDLDKGKLGFTVKVERDGTESVTLNGGVTVVAEEGGDDGDDQSPADASFAVSPKTIEAADFANDKKGVKLSVENCEAGSDVRFRVNPKGLNVTAYDKTVKADDEGNVSVTVFGTSENYSAYVGGYTATATCGDDSMKDSFTVTAGAKGGDSGNDNGNGTDLPRTGADLSGLTTGALLLLVGGAAVVMTGRRRKVGQSPTDI